MNRVWGNAIGIAGLILMLGGAPSWGAPPNNDASDAAANTAGGTGALQNTTAGFYNTADGFGALQNNSTGSVNTASVRGAVGSENGAMITRARTCIARLRPSAGAAIVRS